MKKLVIILSILSCWRKENDNSNLQGSNLQGKLKYNISREVFHNNELISKDDLTAEKDYSSKKTYIKNEYGTTDIEDLIQSKETIKDVDPNLVKIILYAYNTYDVKSDISSLISSLSYEKINESEGRATFKNGYIKYNKSSGFIEAAEFKRLKSDIKTTFEFEYSKGYMSIVNIKSVLGSRSISSKEVWTLKK